MKVSRKVLTRFTVSWDRLVPLMEKALTVHQDQESLVLHQLSV